MTPSTSTPAVRLGDLAHTRSGDKGDRANIGVVANDETSYAWLKDHLTAPLVADYLRLLDVGSVRRYELPNILAFNFVIERALGGGASRSLRLDTQGKALGVALLELKIPAPPFAAGPERLQNEARVGQGDAMSGTLVLREDHGPVTLLVLNRPERRNALNRAMTTELGDVLSGLAASPGVRAVVLTGAGPVFCAGMDLKEAESLGHGAEAERQAIDDLRGIADVVNQLHTLDVPTVAALNGDAVAGGAGLATACDFVVASTSARLAWPEVKRGLVAAVIMHDLIRQAGERRARELLLTGEPIGADQAGRWGLVNRVVAPDAVRTEALALARSLATNGPRALATTKHLIDESSGRPVDLRGSAAVTAAVRVSDEALEGMRAFIEKRPPKWAQGAD